MPSTVDIITAIDGHPLKTMGDLISYLARATADGNPGAGFVRISLVAPEEECVQAAHRICNFIQSRKYTAT